MNNNTTQIFNKTNFMDNFHGMEEVAWEIIANFIVSLPSLKKRIEMAIISKDSSELEIAAHTLKGVVSNFYAEPARVLACKLEEMGHSKMTENNEEIFRVLNIELDRLVIVLEELVKNKG